MTENITRQDLCRPLGVSEDAVLHFILVPGCEMPLSPIAEPGDTLSDGERLWWYDPSVGTWMPQAVYSAAEATAAIRRSDAVVVWDLPEYPAIEACPMPGESIRRALRGDEEVER